MSASFKKPQNLIDRLGEKYLSGECFTFTAIKLLFVPVLLEQCSLVFTAILNSLLISSSGEAAFAAVSLVDTINNFLMNMFIALATGGSIVVSQYMGRKDREKAENAIVQTIISATAVASAIALIIVIFYKPILAMLFNNAEPDVYKNIVIYTFGCCASYPISGVYNATLGTLRGAGKTKVTSQIVITVTIVNILTSILFIKVLNLSIMGVVLSLLCIRIVGATLGLIAINYNFPNIKENIKKYIKLNIGLQKSILFVGIPNAIEQVFFHGGKIVMQSFIVLMGTQMIAINAIGNNVYSLMIIPGNAMCVCVATVVGTCMGAGKPEEARKFIKNLSNAATLMMMTICFAMIPFMKIIIRFYNSDTNVVNYTFGLMLATIVGTITVWGISFVYPGGLRATGDAKFVTITSLISMWTVRVTLGYFLSIVLNWKVYGIWIAMMLEWIVRGGMFFFRTKGSRWQNHNFIK